MLTNRPLVKPVIIICQVQNFIICNLQSSCFHYFINMLLKWFVLWLNYMCLGACISNALARGHISKMLSYQYNNFHYEDKMFLSLWINGNPCISVDNFYIETGLRGMGCYEVCSSCHVHLLCLPGDEAGSGDEAAKSDGEGSRRSRSRSRSRSKSGSRSRSRSKSRSRSQSRSASGSRGGSRSRSRSKSKSRSRSRSRSKSRSRSRSRSGSRSGSPSGSDRRSGSESEAEAGRKKDEEEIFGSGSSDEGD